MSDHFFRWQLGILSIALLGMLVFLGIGQQAGSAQSAAEINSSSLQPGLVKNTASVADWPMPDYDSGRTKTNLQETDFSPPFGALPVKDLSYNPTEWMRPSGILANDMLFWYKTNKFAAGSELIVATDLDGQKIWSHDIPADYTLQSAAPLVAGEEVFFIEIGTDDASNYYSDVVAVDRQTGSLLWRHPTFVEEILEGGSALPIAVQSGTAYLTWEDPNTFQGKLAAVNARTGAVSWEITVDSGGAAPANALAVNNNILVANHFNRLAGYNLATGVEIWDIDAYAGLGIITLVDDILVVNGLAAMVHAGRIAVYDITDGGLEWQENIDQVACVRDVRMFLASDGEKLSVMGLCGDQLRTYDLDTGIELWRETLDKSWDKFNIAIANDTVYVNAFDDDEMTSYVSAHALSDGQQAQRVDVNSFNSETLPFVEDLAVANGQLMVVVRAFNADELYFFSGGSADGYLALLNNDGLVDTNPDSTAEVSIIDLDGVYGAEINVGAQIGELPATFRVYHADGQLYKEASGEPDEFGNGFWFAPLEYVATGYEYQVILNDGSELSRRQVLMPGDPVPSVDYVVRTDGLSWISPPTTVTGSPYTLTLSLPGGFPPGATTAYAILQNTDRGILSVDGLRVADEILVRLDENNAVNGDLTITAAATAGNFTAFSPGLNITVDTPLMPDVRLQQMTAVEPNSDGSGTAVRLSFESQRPAVDPTVQADVQIASVRPDLSGYQVMLWIKTPPEDPLDPRTSKWEVGVMALDEAGNELDRAASEIPPAPEGRYMVMIVTQPGTRPIAALGAFGSTLEGESEETTLLSNWSESPAVSSQLNITGTGSIGICTEGAERFDPRVEYHRILTHLALLRFHVNNVEYEEKRAGYPATIGEGDVRVFGSCFLSPHLSRESYEVSLGNFVGSATGNLRPGVIEFGENSAYRITAQRGDSGYFGIFTLEPEPERNIMRRFGYITCPPPKEEIPRCCAGVVCHQPDPFIHPGADSPDDTLSVVQQNEEDAEEWRYWRSVFAYANSRGFNELSDYARYRQLDLSYLEPISEIPADVSLNEEQQQVVDEYEVFRMFSSAEMVPQRGTIAAQLEQLEADKANVLASGYYREMQALLTSYGIPNRLIGTDFSPDALGGSMIVIPTAGFYGLEADTVFAERLARFVERGGTLLVMTQPGDRSIDLLPGNWGQVDYQQDRSCYLDAMTLVQFHPILASVSTPSLTSPVDGYMTTIPASSQLLMERTKNNEGAFVFYEHGRGQMIVTNMYDDWGRTVGQSSVAVRNLFRDLVRWGSIGGEDLPEVGPGQPVELRVEVANVISEDTAKLEWVVRDPNGILVDSGLVIQHLALSPGQMSHQVVNFTPGDTTLGIWSLNYQLLDGDDDVLQGETQAGYFIVKDPPPLGLSWEPAIPAAPFTPGATDTEVNLSLDQAAYQPGEGVTATLAISLSNPGAVSGLMVDVSLGETTLEQIVPALANQQVVFNLPADFRGNGLMFYGVYETTDYEGLYLNTQWVQPAGTAVTVTPHNPTYAPGETVSLDITGVYTQSLFVEAADFARTIEVSATSTVTFTLPSVLSSGPVQVSYQDSSFQRTARFDVIGPRLTVSSMRTNQPLVAPGGQADIIATIESDRAMDVMVYGKIVDGDGFIFPTVYLTETLAVGEQTLTMTIPISTTTSGSVQFEMSISDAIETAVTYGQAYRFFTINAPALQAVRAAGGPTAPSDNPKVGLDWYAPSAANLEVTLWLDQQAVIADTVALPAGFTTTDVTIPGELAPGVYELYAEADLGDGVTTSVHGTLTVKTASMIAVYLPMVVR